jgi:hypothetical protein
MDNLLYYPHINLPESDWTIRTLLYYNTIGTIVPQEYFNLPDINYEQHMLELVKNELVIPINPLKVLNNSREISRPFLEFIQKPEFNIEKKRNSFGLNNFERIHSNKFKPKGFKIHSDKFDGEIFYQLEQIGLAKKENPNWYIVEYHTASYLMAFLAMVISSNLSMRPITDRIQRRLPNKPNKPNSKRETILRELIPFPNTINLNKLRRFKDKHFDLLNVFKNKVELIVLDEKIIEGTELFKEKVNELRLRKKELSAKMNESQLGNIIFGSICGIIGAIQGLSTAETPGAVIGGLPGFITAIHSALKIEKAENIFDQSGMKYLALVDKRLR